MKKEGHNRLYFPQTKQIHVKCKVLQGVLTTWIHEKEVIVDWIISNSLDKWKKVCHHRLYCCKGCGYSKQSEHKKKRLSQVVFIQNNLDIEAGVEKN